MTKNTLFPHQVEGIKFLKEKKRGILADSMGLGKTKQSLIAAGEESDETILVICPASLKINWQREINLVYPEDEVLIVESGPEIEIGDPAWLIVNYDLLPKYIVQILLLVAEKKLDTAIVDEAHYIKGKGTVRAKNTLSIVTKLKRVYCLTGTPIMNRPIELFNLLQAIGHPLGREGGRSDYAKRYCGAHLKTIFRKDGRVLRFMEEGGATRLPELRESINSVFLRRTKEDTLDLPEKIISTRITELTPEWAEIYTTAWDNYVLWVVEHPDEGKDLEGVLSAQQLVELMKLKQVCSQSKITQIVDDIENAIESGEKVIVFTQYTETVKMIEDGLNIKKIKWVQLTGENKMDERQYAVDSFQNDEKTKVFVANMKAGGVGINLTAASIVIFADMDWSPEVHNQCMDRAHRIGQKGTVNVYFYVAKDTIEEDIENMIERKKAVIKDILGSSETGIEKSAMSEMIRSIKQRI